MKIAIVLIEHDDAANREAFKESLKTPNHQKVLGRIRTHAQITLRDVHIDFVYPPGELLQSRSLRPLPLHSVGMHDQKRKACFRFLEEHLKVTDNDDVPIFGAPDERDFLFGRTGVGAACTDRTLDPGITNQAATRASHSIFNCLNLPRTPHSTFSFHRRALVNSSLLAAVGASVASNYLPSCC